MDHDTWNTERLPKLVCELESLLRNCRSAFGQDRLYYRACALMFGELFTLGRHTLTQVLRALGETEHDHSAWYRLISEKRFPEEQLSKRLVMETLDHVGEDEPYVMTVDGVQIPRTGRHVAGSSWWEAQDTAPFRRGLRMGQRFVEGAWLTPDEGGFCRAIPLRWIPAVTEKAVASNVEPRKEWEAGQDVLKWVRGVLDDHGREKQWILMLADGKYDTQGIWKDLPPRSVVMVRCARNRALYALPKRTPGQRGRPPLYGDRQPGPTAGLRKNKGWQEVVLQVRGYQRPLKYQVRGPYLVEGAPEQPLYLIVVRGQEWKKGQRHPKKKRRHPAFYLISAVEKDGEWVLPYPAEMLLYWMWQRWECEVAHREMKSSLGIGEKQCWSPNSALTAVQWGVWVYSMCVLAAYRAWGICGGPRRSGRWYKGAKRWSFTAMWQAYRGDLWAMSEFHPLYTPSLERWLKTETWMTGLSNAVADPGRI